MARKSLYKIVVLALGLLGVAAPLRAADFNPNLSQAEEVIAGPQVPDAAPPANLTEMAPFAIPNEQPREMLTQLPGKPFRPVTPTPLARAWWKYPFYAVLGLPRDLADAAMGSLNLVPFVSIPLVYLPYEVVPTQFLVRDARDWHRWPGRRNDRDHGMIDGTWGWFPAAHSWHFTTPSPAKARQNQLYNQRLQKELAEENHKIEVFNQVIASRTQDARAKALEAIRAGNGRDAALRMMAYRQAYPLDEGALALYLTGLALYLTDGPPWVAPVLWTTLYSTQPRLLNQAEKLMATTAASFPDRAGLAEALVLTRLMLEKNKAAMLGTSALLKQNPADVRRQRLVFEAALEAANNAVAQSALQTLVAEKYDAGELALMQARLQLAKGEFSPARQKLAELQAAHPDDAYLNYYLGVAELQAGIAGEKPEASFKRAGEFVEKAELTAPGPALRNRAAEVNAFLKGISAGMAEKPEAFSAAPAAPAAAK